MAIRNDLGIDGQIPMAVEAVYDGILPAAPPSPTADGAVKVAQAEASVPPVTVTIELENGNIARLPADADISNVRANGADLEFVQPDGTVIVVPGGAIANLILFVGETEIPAETVALMFSSAGIEPAAGPEGGEPDGTGSYVDLGSQHVGDGFRQNGLLDDDEFGGPGFAGLNSATDNLQPIFRTAGGFFARLSDEGLTGTNADVNPIGGDDQTNAFTMSVTFDAFDPEGLPLDYTFSGEPAPGLRAGGELIDWSLSADGKTLTGTIQGGSVTVIEAVIAGDTANITLYRPIEHPDATREDTASVVLPFQVTDGFTGFVASSITLTIEDDSPETAPNATVALEDEDLSFLYNHGEGEGDDPAPLHTTGTLQGSFGADGAGSVLFTGIALPNDTFDYSISEDGLSITVTQLQDGVSVDVLEITLENTTSGAYEVNQLAVIDHPDGLGENNVQFAVEYTVTDSDLDSKTGTLTVDVDDDGPVAFGNLITQSVEEEELSGGNEDGNGTGSGDIDIDLGWFGFVDLTKDTVVGSLNIAWGADNRDAIGANDGIGRSVYFSDILAPESNVHARDSHGNALTELKSGGMPVTYELTDGNTKLTAWANGEKVFIVSLSDDLFGGYKFELLKPLDQPNPGEDELRFTFDFTAEDSDGDTATNTFTVNVIDDKPLAGANDRVWLDEDNLTDPQGIPNGSGDHNAENVSGVLDHDYGADGAGGTLLSGVVLPEAGGFSSWLSADGKTLIISQVQGEATVEVVKITLTDAVSGAYAVEQLNAIRHPNGGNENDVSFTIQYQVKDKDGDTANSTMRLTVDDDSPLAGSNADVWLDEDNLTNPQGNPGGTLDHEAQNTEGTLAHNYGADGAGTTLLTGATLPGVGNFSVVVSPDGRTLTIRQMQGSETVDVVRVTLADTSSGNYTVEQLAAIKHATGYDENDTAFTINYQVKDADGDPANSSFKLTVDDDTPVAYSATRSVTEGGNGTNNIVLMFDRSGSMDDASGVAGKTRFELAQDAAIKLLDSLAATGDVNKIMVVWFNDNADHNTEGGQVWTSVADAKAYILGLSDPNFDSTSYDAAIDEVMDNWGEGPSSADQTLVYMLSDGDATGFGTINGAAQNTWQNFIAAQGVVKVYGVGVGSGISNLDDLQPVAIPNGDPNNPFVILDEDGLISTTPGQLFGNVLSDGATPDSFGADGGRILSIEVDGVTYTWDGETEITSGAEEGEPIEGSKLVVNTASGGTLTFYFASEDGHAAGDYHYRSPSEVAAATPDEVFSYVLIDGDGDTTNATLTIDLVPVNDSPYANPDHFSRTEADVEATNGTPTTIGNLIAGSDTDSDNDTLTISNVTSFGYGDNDFGLTVNAHSHNREAGEAARYHLDTNFGDAWLTVGVNGEIKLWAEPGEDPFRALAVGQSATISFRYTVSDGHGGTDSAIATIVVNGTNDAPDAGNDSITVTENEVSGASFGNREDVGDLLNNDDDVDGDTLTVQSAGPLNVNLHGDPNMTLVSATADTPPLGGGEAARYTIIISNNGSNEAAHLEVEADGDVKIWSDSGKDPFKGLGVGETATITFNYTVGDGQSGSDTATATITINGSNDAPDANSDTGYVVTEAAIEIAKADGTPQPAIVLASVLSNDTDPDGDTLTVSAVNNFIVSETNPGLQIQSVTELSNGQNGSDVERYRIETNFGTAYVGIQANGQVRIWSDEGEDPFRALGAGDHATISFHYTANDGHGGTDAAPVTITVDGSNDAPVASNNSFSVSENAVEAAKAGNKTNLGNILGNDIDVDGDALHVGTVSALTVGDDDGNFSLSSESVAAGPGEAARFHIWSATGDAYVSVGTDGQVRMWSDNGEDPFRALSLGHQATLTFTYEASDGSLTDTAQTTITVTGSNDAPVAVGDTFGSISEAAVEAAKSSGKIVVGNVLTGDSDPDGDSFAVSDFRDVVITESSPGFQATVVAEGDGSDVDRFRIETTYGDAHIGIAPNGQVTLWSDDGVDPFRGLGDGESAVITFTYEIQDANGATATATASLTVTGTNDAPTLSLGTTSGQYLDQFNTAAYTNSNGTTTWSDDWDEEFDGPENNATTQDIRITGGELRFTDSDNDDSSISRDINLSNANSATLEFDYRRSGLDNGNDEVRVYISKDGVSFTLLATIEGPSNTGGHLTFDISAYAGSNTVLRFVADADLSDSSTPGNGSSADFVFIDNVKISFTTPAVDHATAYTENGAGVSIAANSVVGDVDDTQMVSAKIVLTNAQAGDVLTATALPGGIVTSIDSSVPGKLTLTLTGQASKADYAAAIAGVKFSNTSDDPSGVTRLIETTVNDGLADSNVAHTSIAFAAVNDAPVSTLPSQTTVAEDGSVVLTGLSVSDADAGAGALTVTLSVQHGTLQMGSGTPAASVQITGTLAAVNAALQTITYKPTTNFNGGDTLTMVTSDNGNSPGPAQTDTDTTGITVTSVVDHVFTDSGETRDLRTFSANQTSTSPDNPYFEDSNYLDAMNGNDTVYLPDAVNGLGQKYSDLYAAGYIFTGGAGDDTIHGGDLNDRISGGSGSDTLSGGAGNDQFFLGADLVVGAGNQRSLELGDGTTRSVNIGGLAGTQDKVSGGTGYDTIHLEQGAGAGYAHDTYLAPSYISGVEQINGTDGGDVIMIDDSYMSDAAGGGIVIEGGAGNDSLGGGAGTDNIRGGDNDDLISGLGGADTLEGGAGNDEIWGGQGADQIKGGAGNDTIIGGADNDILEGGAGDDTFLYKPGNGAGVVGEGSDSVDGGDDEDTLKVNRLTTEQNVYYVAGTAAGFDLTAWHYGVGTPDVLTTENVENVEIELKGNEQVVLQGNLTGTNVLVEGDVAGNSLALNSLSAITSVTAHLGAGNDEVYAGNHTTGAVVDGGADIDLAQYGLVNGPVSIDLEAGTAVRATATDTITNFENVVGTTSRDTIHGSSVGNVVDGGNGNDVMEGRGGADTLTGGAGNDRIVGGAELLVNGGFNGPSEVIVGNGSQLIDLGGGWTIASGNVDLLFVPGSLNASFPAGVNAVDMQGMSNGTITQDFATEVGKTYTVTFLQSTNPGILGNTPDTSSAVMVSAGADSATFTHHASGDWNGLASTFVERTFTFTATSTTTTLSIAAVAGSGPHYYGSLIANVSAISADAASDAGDTITGGAGNDVLSGGLGNDLIDGDDDDDIVSGGAGTDTLTGGAGSDFLAGGVGDDSVLGGTGDDTVSYVVGEGRDTVDGGDNTDTLNVYGDNAGQAFHIETALAFNARTGGTIAGEIAIASGAGASDLILDIDNVEEMAVNGGGGADTFAVSGDFSTTSLATSTLHIDASDGADTLDLTALANTRRVVSDGGTGADTVKLGFDWSAATFGKIFNAQNVLIGANITIGGVTHSFTNYETFLLNGEERTLAELFNVAPETADSSATGDEDSIFEVVLMATDADSNQTGFVITTPPGHGTFYLDAAGTELAGANITGASPLTLYFKPEANWSGTTEFEYAARDKFGLVDGSPATGTIEVLAVNDAPEISGAPNEPVFLTESGDIAGIDEAGLTREFEPAGIPLSATVLSTLAGLETAPDGVAAALVTIADELGGDAGLIQAYAITWDYLDDAYQTSAYQPNINEAFIRLGIAYASAVEAGEIDAFVDVVAKYTPDSNNDGIPQRLQSLHDNLLGNLRTASLDQRFGPGSPTANDALLQVLTDAVHAVDPNLLTREWYSGNQGDDAAAERLWDLQNGYVPVASGHLTGNDVDTGAVLTWSASPTAGTYGTFSVDQNGNWKFVLDNTLPATQQLAEGQIGTQTFTVTLTDDAGATDQVDITIKVQGTNDAPVIAGSVTTPFAGGALTSVVDADTSPGYDFEPVVNHDATIQAALSSQPTMAAVLAYVNSQDGGTGADAIAWVWDLLDQGYVSGGPLQHPVNQAFAQLGVEYAKYLAAGGIPLYGLAAKYTADGIDGGTDPDRLQTLHDNLLGNLAAASLAQRFTGPGNPTYDAIVNALKAAGVADLLERPYYAGNEGEANNALAWDQQHGYLPASAGQIQATDVDSDVLTYSVADDGDGQFGTFDLDPATGKWSYTVDRESADYKGLDAGETANESFVVTVADNHGGIDTITVTVTATGINDAPTDIALSNLAVAADNVLGTDIATVAVTDADDTAFTFVVRNPNGTINSDVAVTGTPGNYMLEVVNSSGVNSLPPSLSITATDDSGATYTESFVLTLPIRLFSAGNQLLGSFDSIQGAINAAGDGLGEYISVPAGTYAENITIDKGVEIRGANSGIDGDDAGRGGETVINGQWTINTGNAVVIDGLRFNNVSPAGQGSDATLSFLKGGNGAGHVVENTVFFSAVDGGDTKDTSSDSDPVRDDRAIFVGPGANTGKIVIDDNLITGSSIGKYGTASWGRGIWSDGNGVDLTISDNTISNTRSGMNLDATAPAPQTLIHVEGNTFTDVGTAISLGANWSGDTTDAFQDNTFNNVDLEFNLQNLLQAITLDAGDGLAGITDGTPDSPAADAFYILGGQASDTITGTASNDVIVGNGGDDVLIGGAGDDTLVYTVGGGSDRIDGGSETGSTNPNYDVLAVRGDAQDRTFTVGKLAQGDGSNIVPAGPGAVDLDDVTISYTGSNAATVRADEIERIEFTAGTGAMNVVLNDTTGTAILPSTIVVNGGSGDDSIELTNFSGAARVVFNGGGDHSLDDENWTYGDLVDFGDRSWKDAVITVSSGGTYTITFDDLVVEATNVEVFQFAEGLAGSDQLIEVAPYYSTDPLDFTFSIDENSAAGVAVGKPYVEDYNGVIDKPTYAFSTSQGLSQTSEDGRFVIDAATGLIKVAQGAVLDYETTPGHSFTYEVHVTDNKGGTASGPVIISLKDVYEAPPPSNHAPTAAGYAFGIGRTYGTSHNAFWDPAHASYTIDLAALSAIVDVDGQSTLTWTSANLPSSHWNLGSNGVLTYDSNTASGVYEFTVTANDGTATASRVVSVWIGGALQWTESPGSGDDTLFGTGSDDSIDAKNGNDFVYGAGYHDDLDGGSGDDVIYGGANDPVLDATGEYESLSGASGRDYIDGESGNDWILGGSDDDYLVGGAGNDILWGDQGHDILVGGLGDDQLEGGSNNDVLVGGAGDDTLVGGSGMDRFVFEPGLGSDFIADLETGAGGDILDLAALLTNWATGKDAHVRVTYADNTTHLVSDANGGVVDGDVRVHVETTAGNWVEVARIDDTGGNLTGGNDVIRFILDGTNIVTDNI